MTIPDILKEDGSPYTPTEWVDFYTSSTGVPSSNSSGGGGVAGGSVEANKI